MPGAFSPNNNFGSPPPTGGKGGANMNGGQMPFSPGSNMFQNAATANNMGMAGAAREMGYQARPIFSGAYSASQINPNTGGNVAAGRAGAQMLDTNLGQFNAAQTTQADIDRFMNPYIDDVVGGARRDIQSQADQQRNQAMAEAQAAGAFGGSRGALIESQILNDAGERLADTSGNLRMQGFNTALANAQQDVARRMQANMGNAANRIALGQGNQQTGAQVSIANANNTTQAGIAGAANSLQAALANMGAQNAANQFNIANRFAADQFNENNRLSASGQRLGAGAQLGSIGSQAFNQTQDVLSGQQNAGGQIQGLMQQLINSSSGQFDAFRNQPQQALGFHSQALGATQVPQNQTTSRQPGLFDWISLGLAG
jgi:hypothetical protein